MSIPMTFNFVAGMGIYAVGFYLLGAIPPDSNKWRAAWFYFGAVTAVVFGGLAIVRVI